MDFDNIRIILSCLVSLITIPKLIYEFFNRNKCTPCYTLMTKQFISSECQRFDNLKIAYNGNDISKFTVTTFVFWNKGKIKLSKEDYGKYIPSICCNTNCQILDYKIRDVYDDDFINLKETFKDDKLYFEFDTISKGQGFVINLLHTGTSNKDIICNFKFNTIKYKKVLLYNRKRKDIFSAISSTLIWIISLMIMILFLIGGIFVHWDLKTTFIWLLLTLFVLMGTILNIRELYVPYMGVPKQFQKYFDEIDF